MSWLNQCNKPQGGAICSSATKVGVAGLIISIFAFGAAIAVRVGWPGPELYYGFYAIELLGVYGSYAVVPLMFIIWILDIFLTLALINGASNAAQAHKCHGAYYFHLPVNCIWHPPIHPSILFVPKACMQPPTCSLSLCIFISRYLTPDSPNYVLQLSCVDVLNKNNATFGVAAWTATAFAIFSFCCSLIVWAMGVYATVTVNTGLFCVGACFEYGSVQLSFAILLVVSHSVSTSMGCKLDAYAKSGRRGQQRARQYDVEMGQRKQTTGQ